MAYRIFVRSWYKKDPKNPNKLVPNAGARKTTIGSAATYEGAVEQCKAYNDTHNPGRYSRKAEFERI